MHGIVDQHAAKPAADQGLCQTARIVIAERRIYAVAGNNARQYLAHSVNHRVCPLVISGGVIASQYAQIYFCAANRRFNGCLCAGQRTEVKITYV